MVKEEDFSKLVNSSVLIAVGFVVAGLLSILTRVLLGRFLEPEGYGMLSEGLAILNFFVIFALLGTSEGVARFISYREKRENTISSALALCLVTSVITGLIVFLFSENIAYLLDNESLSPVIKAFGLNIPAYVVTSVLIGGFRGEKRTAEKVLLQNLTLPLLIILSAAPLAFVYTSPSMAAAGYLLAGWLTMFIGLIIYYNKRCLNRPSFSRMKDLLSFSSPLMVAEYASFGLIWINILLLGYLIDSSAAGIYNAALPLSYAITFALTAVNYLFMPLTSTSFAENRIEDIKSLYQTVVRWIIVLSLPLVLVLILKPDFIVTTLFGSSYSAASSVLVIIALGRFVDVAMGPLGQLLISIGDTAQEGISKVLGVLILTSSSLLLIPVYGVDGAAAGFLIGFTVTNLLRLFFVRRHFTITPLNKDLVKPVLAGLISSPILLIGFEGIVSNISAIFGFGVLYVLIFLSLKPLKNEDIEAFLQVYSKIGLKPEYKEKLRNLLSKCQRET